MTPLHVTPSEVEQDEPYSILWWVWLVGFRPEAQRHYVGRN